MNILKSIYSSIKQQILNLFFPLKCIGCQTKNTWLCDNCIKNIPLRTSQTCFICKKENSPFGEHCFRCQKNIFSLDGIFSASYYKNKLLAKLIHLYKYEFIDSLHRPLGEILTTALLQSNIPFPDIICFVPLHPLRLRWRNFNQSELLAQYIYQNSNFSTNHPLFINILRRIRFTLPQMNLANKVERKNNIINAFKLEFANQENFLQGKYIWIIDDVATTNSTLEECAKILKQSGAKKVTGIVLAH